MYLKRKIDKYLHEWKADKNHKPLIIRGARQIGKTESIRHFADAEYGNVIYINFALEKKYASVVSDGYEVSNIIKNITLIDPEKKFVEDDTLIIFDEIQEYPDIATSLKSFRIDGRYDVMQRIHAGDQCKIHSNSVGSSGYQMFSMDRVNGRSYTDEHGRYCLT